MLANMYLFNIAALLAATVLSSNTTMAYNNEMKPTSDTSATAIATATATATEIMTTTARRTLCDLQECTVVCPANLTDFQESMYSSSCNSVARVVTLKLLTSKQGVWMKQVVEQFSLARPEVNVEIVELENNADLSENIVNEAKSKTGLFDIFITPPNVMGDIVEEDGWCDLTDFVDSSISRTKDWSDIFLSYRKWISHFQDKILMFPLDGDVLSMFYREDVLEDFGLKVPRTWDEYNAVANATHGKLYNNKTLIGSCVGRMQGCAGAYWANLVLSSMTQRRGMSSGSLFDTLDMTPLLGDAFVQALEWMEIQAKFGPADEFDGCVGINKGTMNDGSCVLTYSWGNNFMVHLNEGTVFEKGEAKMGVAMTPGSTHVLDRKSMKLVPCDEDLCKSGGIYYDDIGWVNRSPYLAFGGWGCAVNNYTTPEKKALASEFCAYASSQKQSNKLIAQDSSTAKAGPDPFRKSQLDVSLWTDNGYELDGVVDYFDTISAALRSENAVLDIRFPISKDIYGLLDKEVHDYLNGTVTNSIPESERLSVRQAIGDRLTEQFNAMIYEYDSKASTRSTLLQQYQKLRNTFVVDVDTNCMGNTLRYYGYSIAILTMTMAIAFAIWTYVHRSSPVIRASQPFFLILVCVGVFIFSSSIFPMTIDDDQFSVETCNKACMLLPWLLCLGWSVLFSALYAKLRRINLVISNAMAFRSVKISEKDMMVSFSILFTSNLILMTLWSIFDPLVWQRYQISPSESIGYCTMANENSVAWKPIVVLLGLLNGGVLIVANVEAYKARKIDTEYGESVYIGLIMLCFLQVILVGLPLFFLVYYNSMARFFLTSSIVFIMSMSVLLLIFVPKWRIYRKRLSKSLKGTKRNSNVRISTLSFGISKTAEQSNIFQDADRAVQARISYEDAWNKRIVNLEGVLQEAGIDAKLYLRKANIFNDQNKVAPIELDNQRESLVRRLRPNNSRTISREFDSNGLEKALTKRSIRINSELCRNKESLDVEVFQQSKSIPPTFEPLPVVADPQKITEEGTSTESLSFELPTIPNKMTGSISEVSDNDDASAQV